MSRKGRGVQELEVGVDGISWVGREWRMGEVENGEYGTVELERG